MSRTTFCVVTTARSGSTFLCALLDSVPGVLCQGELFHKRRIHLAKRHRLDLQVSLDERDRDPIGFLHRVEALGVEQWPEVAASGFKLFLTHNATILNHVVSQDDYRVVFLRRKNALAQYSSNLLAKLAGRWARRDPHPRFEEGVVRFDGDEFRTFMASQNRGFDEVARQLEARNSESVTVNFDEIKSEAAIQRVLRFVGVDYDGDLTALMEGVPVTRENLPSIIDRFSNPDDVIVAMRELGTDEWLGPEFASDLAPEGDRRSHGEFRPPVSTIFKGARFSTNRWGMRDKDYEKAPPPATRRIAVLGSSLVMGAGVNDGEPFEQVVEDQLNRDLSPRTGLHYELLNFGVSAYSLAQQANLLESAWVGQFKPDAVLMVGHGANDARAVARYVGNAAVRGHDLLEPARTLARNAGVVRGMPEPEAQRRLQPYASDLVRWTLGRAATAIRHMGAQPILALIPVPRDPLDPPGRPLLVSSALDSGFVVIDIQDVFQGHEPAQLALSADDHYPNAEGHRLIAARLCAELVTLVGMLTVVDEQAESVKARAQREWAAIAPTRKALRDWRKRWRVETHEGSVADVEHSPAEPGLIRVTIAQLPHPVGWHVKLRQAPLPIRKDDRYLLTFRMRADAPRAVACGVEQNVQPWGLLGLFSELEVTSQWQTFDCPFTAIGTESNARVFWDLGSSDVPVEVADVMLRNLSAAQDTTPRCP